MSQIEAEPGLWTILRADGLQRMMSRKMSLVERY